jgi:hypothetical protein
MMGGPDPEIAHLLDGLVGSVLSRSLIILSTWDPILAEFQWLQAVNHTHRDIQQESDSTDLFSLINQSNPVSENLE